MPLVATALRTRISGTVGTGVSGKFATIWSIRAGCTVAIVGIPGGPVDDPLSPRLAADLKQIALIAACAAFAPAAAVAWRGVDDGPLLAVGEAELDSLAGMQILRRSHQRAVLFPMHHDEP